MRTEENSPVEAGRTSRLISLRYIASIKQDGISMETELPISLKTAHCPKRGTHMTRLYIGNLPQETTEVDVQSWLEAYGFKVESVQVIRDLDTGVSRGFGFAELPHANADEAVQALDGHSMENAAVRVSKARPVLLKNDNGRQANSGKPAGRRIS